MNLAEHFMQAACPDRPDVSSAGRARVERESSAGRARVDEPAAPIRAACEPRLASRSRPGRDHDPAARALVLARSLLNQPGAALESLLLVAIRPSPRQNPDSLPAWPESDI
jgi:hypothetical protein